MIIACTIIALIIISGLGMSIYALFIPFLQNLSTMQAYNSAYYGAIAGTERALLITRQQGFGFDGSGGREGEVNRGPVSDHKTDDMDSLSEQDNGIARSIQGTTKRIPQTQKGNIPNAFSSIDSNEYNMFASADTVKIRLESNNNTDVNNFYNSDDRVIEKFAGENIQTHRRIPPKIQENLGGTSNTLLCDDNTHIGCDTNQDGIHDDILIARQREGTSNGKPFTILPSSQTIHSEGGSTIDYQQDSHIRESIINNDALTPLIPIINFTNSMNPIQKNTLLTTIDTHHAIGPGAEEIEHKTFTTLLQDPNITGLVLRYDMIQKPINRNAYVYPFLEGYISADQKFSDTDRHITGQGREGSYNIHIYLQKPQGTNTQGGNFTIVF